MDLELSTHSISVIVDHHVRNCFSGPNVLDLVDDVVTAVDSIHRALPRGPRYGVVAVYVADFFGAKFMLACLESAVHFIQLVVSICFSPMSEPHSGHL
jgi:hypothetical protein